MPASYSVPYADHMARSQTLVQLTDELVAALDRHAAADGRSRSAVIREAVGHWLAERDRALAVERWVAGYADLPVAEPDDWGDPVADAATHGHELAQRLDAEDAAHGRDW